MPGKISSETKRRIAATVAFFSEAVRFVIIPLVILHVIITNIPFSILTPDALSLLASNLILFGGLIALFAAMEAYFLPGSWLRMIFGLLAVATLCAWFWFVFAGDDIRIPIGPINLTINLAGLVMLILFAVSLKGIIPVALFLMKRGDIARRRQESMAASMSQHPLAPVVTTATNQDKALDDLPPPDDIEPPPPEDFMIDCPICRERISGFEDNCPHCGAWIRQKTNF